MLTIEEIYQAEIDKMSHAEKLQRMHGLLRWIRELYARKVRESLGPISEDRLRWEVARHLYSGDRRATELIQEHLDHVHP